MTWSDFDWKHHHHDWTPLHVQCTFKGCVKIHIFNIFSIQYLLPQYACILEWFLAPKIISFYSNLHICRCHSMASDSDLLGGISDRVGAGGLTDSVVEKQTPLGYKFDGWARFSFKNKLSSMGSGKEMQFVSFVNCHFQLTGMEYHNKSQYAWYHNVSWIIPPQLPI